MQLATVQLLDAEHTYRAVAAAFWNEPTWMLPRNVLLFCTKRNGRRRVDDSRTTTTKKVRLVPLDSSITDNNTNKKGPRVAVGNVAGKGAVARALQLTHLIDDREDWLLSFVLEGHLSSSLSSLSCCGLKDGAVIHVGSLASVPTEERIRVFLKDDDEDGLQKKKKNQADNIVLACQQSWILAVNGWPDVLESFGIADYDEDDD